MKNEATSRISSVKSTISVESESAILHAFRKAYPAETIAFFRKSGVSGSGFKPSFSILGLKPLEVIQSENGKNHIQTPKGDSFTPGSPFKVLEERLSASPTLPDVPYFKGGAMGYFSYDSVRFLERTLPQGKKPTDEPTFDAEIVFFQFYLIFDHQANTVQILNRGEEAETERFEQELKTMLKTHPKSAFSHSVTEPLPVGKMNSLFGKEAFLKGVLRLKEHIREGDIFQAVLSERFQTSFSGDSLTLFETLSEISPAPYQFYFTIQGRSYLGASPEMLLQSEEGVLETHPIAGTRPRGKTEEEELEHEKTLLADVKEKAEHLMLVDLARNDLGRVSKPGTVNVDTFQKIRKFGGVMHLVSVVKAKKKDSLSSVQAFASCFPAGTLSGAPKIRAMQLLSELELEPRGFYGGAFFVSGFDGNLDSCISIRSISIANGKATIQAGAGIVADSVPENEYAEVLHKSRLTRLALAKVGQS